MNTFTTPEEIVKIVRTKIEVNGVLKGYKFVALNAAGKAVVVRAKATRPYTHAVIYTKGVNTKFGFGSAASKAVDAPVKAAVTFHSSAHPAVDRRVKHLVARVIPVEGRDTYGTVEEVKAAVIAGKTVHWANRAYVVIVDSIGQWLIHRADNNYYTGFGETDVRDCYTTGGTK